MTDQELERALRRALQPTSPGEDFSTTVIACVQAAGAGRARRSFRSSRRWIPAALAACALIEVGLGHWRPAGDTRERGLEARAELLQALRIAGEQVNAARTTVMKEERPLIGGSNP